MYKCILLLCVRQQGERANVRKNTLLSAEAHSLWKDYNELYVNGASERKSGLIDDRRANSVKCVFVEEGVVLVVVVLDIEFSDDEAGANEWMRW